MSFEPNYVIVGAGLAGLVLAERICTQLGRMCLILEKRNHIGGNCHGKMDEHGVLVHTYGPHYFRTNSPRVREYLTDFTAWHRVNYQIKAHTDGSYCSFPVNLNSFEELLGRSSSSDEFEAWLAARRIPAPNPANSEDVITSQIGTELYEKFFLGYTLKQWKRHPRDLTPSVCGRIPVRTNRDDRYLSEEFQPLPTRHMSAAEVLRFRDQAWHKYFADPGYLALVEKKFGLAQRQNVEAMSQIKLRRKLLGD